MSKHTFVPKDRHGMTQVLNWDGPGWYGSVSCWGETCVWKYAGEWDEDGFSLDPEAEVQRIQDARQSLGTPFYLASIADFGGDDFVEVD